jgi:hypothetical protein
MHAVDVDWWLLVAGAFALGFAGFAGLQLARLPRVWRGGTVSSLPWPNSRGPEVNHRSFPVFVGFAVSMAGGAVMLLVATLVDARALGVIGVLCAMVGVGVFVPLWILINAVNRPRVLVPPSRRSQRGWWAERRALRLRRASGLALTEHVVEVLDVRPPLDEKRPYDPYVVAVCSADDCGWSSDPIGRDKAHPDAERSVREQASRHSSNITGPRRPLG